MQTLLVQRLNEADEEQREQQPEAESSAAAAEGESVGMSQHDLLTWYFNHMIEM